MEKAKGMEPWQTLPSPLLSSLLFFSSPLLLFSCPVKQLQMSDLSTPCVCIHISHSTRLRSSLPQWDFSHHTSTGRQSRSFAEKRRSVMEKCVCVKKWWACGSCDWSKTLTLFIFQPVRRSFVDRFSWTSCISWCARAMACCWTWDWHFAKETHRKPPQTFFLTSFFSAKQPLVNIYIISLFQQEGPHKRHFSCSAEKSKDLHFG